MKYAVEMGSDTIIYVHTNFLRDWFRHSKVEWDKAKKEEKKKGKAIPVTDREGP
jgi:hypothetical protein